MNKVIILYLALAISAGVVIGQSSTTDTSTDSTEPTTTTTVVTTTTAAGTTTTAETTTAGTTTTATTTTAAPAPDPPCTKAGYFASNTPGNYYRCVYSTANGGRWIRYPYSCPAGQKFNETTQKCAA